MKTSAEVLEFEALRQLLGRYIASPLGKRELEKVRPFADRAQLDTALAEAGEAIQYLHAALHPHPGDACVAPAGSRKRSSSVSRCWTWPPTPSRTWPPPPSAFRCWAAAPPPSASSAPCCANWMARYRPTAARPI